MRKKSLDKIIIENLPLVDIPLLMFMGVAIGFMLSGTLLTTIAVFLGSEYTPWTRILLTGIMDFGISSCIGGIAWVYWKLVLSKTGPVFPMLSGFGLLLGLMALFSAMILGTQFV